ncbi:hypothetical protein BS17DRAFT_376067 [Gyrodon lividus]|nr:hypothetical protein BS17DRAFT_376067 [Gyrodon lividus]
MTQHHGRSKYIAGWRSHRGMILRPCLVGSLSRLLLCAVSCLQGRSHKARRCVVLTHLFEHDFASFSSSCCWLESMSIESYVAKNLRHS